VALGVAATPADVPLRLLLDAGIGVALGADDPLLFGRRLTAQYQLAREAHGLSDGQLAELARMSVRGSVAPAAIRSRLLAGIDAWLSSPAAARPPERCPAAVPRPVADYGARRHDR
jgi:adenosine deaminase